MITIYAKKRGSYTVIMGLQEEIDTLLRAIKYAGTDHVNTFPLAYRDVIKRAAEAIPLEAISNDD